ncbi:MAG TPA: hypothetical protein VFD77_08480 [Brumimicrobium sp.]|nr:hypothetical protein [Brumimicrobium sp.]
MKNLLLILLLVFMAASCSKEKRIEKNLWKNGGEWNIDVFWFETKSNGLKIGITEIDFGTIIFHENGTGLLIFEDGQVSNSFSYSITKDELTLVYDEGANPLKKGAMQWKKNDLRLEFEETTEGANGQLTHTKKSFHLKKNK